MTIDQFEHTLERKGHAVGPNNASYKIIVIDGPADHYGIERVFNGNRETIVGFNSQTFETMTAARLWARTDARHEMGPHGTPLNERRALC